MKKFWLGCSAAAVIVAGGAAFAQPSARPQMMQTETRADVQAYVDQMFSHLDSNHDGFLANAEVDAMPAQREAGMHQELSIWIPVRESRFEGADMNKDGRVSSAEAQQFALQRFDRADLNHDGKLTPEERKQTQQQL
jgi:hypothetical protein